MSFQGAIQIDHPWGAMFSQRPDGDWVLDVSGPLSTSATVPVFALCLKCAEVRPVYLSDVPLKATPLADGYATGKTCDRGHALHEPEYSTVFDNTPGRKPRILHLRRPPSAQLGGAGWLTRDQADALLASARDLLEGRDTSGAFARAIDDAPEPIRRLRKSKMTRADWFALAALVVSIIGVAFQGVSTVADINADQSSVHEDQLVEIIDKLIEEQSNPGTP